MKLNAVAVTAKNLKKTVKFYSLLGFQFSEFTEDEQHVETIANGDAKLMVDSTTMIKDILGEEPKPGNHSSFAVQYDSPEEVNEVARKIKEAGFTLVKEPWNAFWGQRYCVVQDPDGYMVDLYAYLSK
ncbi:MAG TPA: VOC family protein [Candidatus Woesebacteria bacterium]|nr:VOC family protein [Candidatus Woesebacteria bacterium]